jgi:hypothetical protein
VAPVAESCVHCGHFEQRGTTAVRAAAVAYQAAGYLLEAAALFPLFRMTMAEAARPSWPESWWIVGGLAVAAAGLRWFAARAGRRSPASEWKAT